MRLLRNPFRTTDDRRRLMTTDSPSDRRRAPNEGWYRSGTCRPLTAGQVRDRRFRSLRRDGLDPLEVYAFLHRVAGELAVARRELAYTVEENVRIKRALRSWQSRFAPRVHR